MPELGRAHLFGLQVVPKGVPGPMGPGRQEQVDLLGHGPMDLVHSEMHPPVLEPAQCRFQNSRLLEGLEAVVSGRHWMTTPHIGH